MKHGLGGNRLVLMGAMQASMGVDMHFGLSFSMSADLLATEHGASWFTPLACAVEMGLEQ